MRAASVGSPDIFSRFLLGSYSLINSDRQGPIWIIWVGLSPPAHRLPHPAPPQPQPRPEPHLQSQSYEWVHSRATGQSSAKIKITCRGSECHGCCQDRGAAPVLVVLLQWPHLKVHNFQVNYAAHTQNPIYVCPVALPYRLTDWIRSQLSWSHFACETIKYPVKLKG